MKPIDAQLEQVARGDGLLQRIRQRQQTRLLAAFQAFRQEGGGGSVLNVCAHASGREPLAIAGDLDEPVVQCTLELHGQARQRYARQDGQQLMFGDGEFDWVACDGVLEQAGDFDRQFELLKEMNRVARKGIFVTAANRRYPVDLETGLPLLHWLPPTLWHRLAGLPRDSGRHLLTSGDLARLASLLPGRHSSDIGHVRLGGPKAHFFLMIRKEKG